jgi:hypothetical protein
MDVTDTVVVTDSFARGWNMITTSVLESTSSSLLVAHVGANTPKLSWNKQSVDDLGNGRVLPVGIAVITTAKSTVAATVRHVDRTRSAHGTPGSLKRVERIKGSEKMREGEGQDEHRFVGEVGGRNSVRVDDEAIAGRREFFL